MNRIENPYPAALAVRMAAEGATALDPLESVRESIYQKSATKEHYTRVQWGEVWGAK